MPIFAPSQRFLHNTNYKLYLVYSPFKLKVLSSLLALKNMQCYPSRAGFGRLARVVPRIAGRGVLHQELTDGVLGRLHDGANAAPGTQPRYLLK